MNNMTEQNVCDLLREKSLLTEKGISLALNGDFVSLNLSAITAIVNAALASQASKGAEAVQVPVEVNTVILSSKAVKAMAATYHSSVEVFVSEAIRLGGQVVAAQAQPVADPMDWPLPCDVTVGNGTHKKGVPLRSLVARMTVLHGMAKSQPVADAAPVEAKPVDRAAAHRKALAMEGEAPHCIGPAFDAVQAYEPGGWFDARTIDEMQAFYLSRLPTIRAAAREHGYAIGLHGSTRRDFDLMAMQWRADASDKDSLARAIADAACGIRREGAYDWEAKPSGRVATSLPICWTDHSNPDFDGMISAGHIDLSIIDQPSTAQGGDFAKGRAAGIEEAAKWFVANADCHQKSAEAAVRALAAKPAEGK